MNIWASANQVSRLTLNPGNTYRFGVRIHRGDAGAVDVGGWRCEVLAEITYRDAGASALGTSAEPVMPAGGDR